jgi:hypothetical protein
MPSAFADVQVAAAQRLSRRDYKRTLHVDRRSVKIEKFSGEGDRVIRLPLPTGVRSCMRSPCILRQEGGAAHETENGRVDCAKCVRSH